MAEMEGGAPQIAMEGAEAQPETEAQGAEAQPEMEAEGAEAQPEMEAEGAEAQPEMEAEVENYNRLFFRHDEHDDSDYFSEDEESTVNDRLEAFASDK